MAKETTKLIWADTSSEGDFPHCTLYAISKAICDYGRKIQCELEFEEIKSNLFQYLKLSQPSGVSDGWYPNAFDGINLPRISSFISQDTKYGNITISVTEEAPSSKFMFEEEYVLMQHGKQKEHCMQVICKMKMDDIKYFLCRGNKTTAATNSEAGGTYDKVQTEKEGIDLYTVRISFNTAFVPPDEIFGKLKSCKSVEEPGSPQGLFAPWKETNNPMTISCISQIISNHCQKMGISIPPLEINQTIMEEFSHKCKLQKTENHDINPDEATNKFCAGTITSKKCDEILHFLGDGNLQIEAQIGKITKVESSDSADEYTMAGTPRGTRAMGFSQLDGQDDEGDGTNERTSFICRDIAIIVDTKCTKAMKCAIKDKKVLFRVKSEEIEEPREQGWTLI